MQNPSELRAEQLTHARKTSSEREHEHAILGEFTFDPRATVIALRPKLLKIGL
jgi:hypothetical protein